MTNLGRAGVAWTGLALVAGCGTGVLALGPGDDTGLAARIALGLAVTAVADALTMVDTTGQRLVARQTTGDVL